MTIDDEKLGILIFVAIMVAVVIYFAGTFVGHFEGEHKIRTQAVSIGHAYWEVSADGKTKFVWKYPNE
jgi:hypothetical protein